MSGGTGDKGYKASSLAIERSDRSVAIELIDVARDFSGSDLAAEGGRAAQTHKKERRRCPPILVF